MPNARPSGLASAVPFKGTPMCCMEGVCASECACARACVCVCARAWVCAHACVREWTTEKSNTANYLVEAGYTHASQNFLE